LKAANLEQDVSSNDRLKAIQHAFQRSVAAATTSSSTHNNWDQAVDTSSQPAQHVTQQNTFPGLASTILETQALIDIGNPLPPAPDAVPAKVDRLPKKMSTQGSLPQDTQPVSQSIYETILNKVKSGRQLDQGTDIRDGVEVEQDSLHEGDEGHIDLLSSYKPQELDLANESDSEPVDFSPTQTQHHLSQFPESQRFKTPGTTSRKRDYNGEIVDTPSLPRNPLARRDAPTPGKMMGLSQAFAATQAVSSPLINGLPSGPLSDRPSPNIELQTRPATVTLSSPLRPRSDLRRTATEPYSHYKSIKQSQAERERISLFGKQDGDILGDNVSDDDFDDEPSQVERSRRLKEREEKVREQLEAVSSPTRPCLRGAAGLLSSPTFRPQLSSPRTSPRSYDRRTGLIQENRLISSIPEEPKNGLADSTHESEEETEQEDEVEIPQSSQMVVHTEEDKENFGLARLEVPETVARLPSPVNGYHVLESSPSVRQAAGFDRKKDEPADSSGKEPFAVANSQPSQSTQKPAQAPRTQLTSSGGGLSCVPQSQVLSDGTHTSSSPERTNLVQSSTNFGGGGAAEANAEREVVVECKSSGNDPLPSSESGGPDLGAGPGDEMNDVPAATIKSPRQSFNETSIAETTGQVVQARRFASRRAQMTETTIPETTSLGLKESDLASSAPQLDSSKPASSSSEHVPRSSTEFETARTHLSTTARAVLPSLPRLPSYVKDSPSGRKRRRMIEITEDPSPGKPASDFDMYVAMAIPVDNEAQEIFGSSSPIPLGRHRKRLRLQDRQTSVLAEEAMPPIAEDQERVTPKPDKSPATAPEDVLLSDHVDINSIDPSQNSPQAMQPLLRSTEVRRQLAAPIQRSSLGRTSARSSRAKGSIFDVEVSPKKSEVTKHNRSAARSQGPPSTMPPSKGRASFAISAPRSTTQIGRSARRGSRGSVPTPYESPGPLALDASKTTGPESNVSLGDVIAPNQVLACFNGKTRAYYPATCLGITGSDSSRYQIQWEGFEADETDARGVRKLDLRVGDAVKVNLDGFPKVSHVVRGFKDKLLPSEKDCPMTDIRGYSILLVAPKQRKSLPANLSAETIKEVPMSAIYLDSNMWGQMKGREYEYTPQQPVSVLGFATPPERPSTPATPSSRSRRNLALSTNSAPTEPLGIFAGMAFAISYDEARKSSLAHLIHANGGMVLQEGFHELFASDSMTPKASYANLGFTALIADRHSRKEKYMQALALNLPCLSGRWIESCITKEDVIDWQPYLLPAGESAVLDGAIRSRILPAIPEPSNAKMIELIETRPRLLNDSAVIFVTGRGKVEEKRKPFVFLAQAVGAGRIEKVIDLKAVMTLLDNDDSQSEGYKWVFVDDAQIGQAETMLTGGIDDQVRVVGNEFICQSLILGGLVEEENP
jgi:hypothetical protein